VLVCDGPLTEGLNKVIEFYEELSPALKVVRLEKNMGLGHALNYGLKQCTYELIARSDSDDVCTPNRFEKQIDHMLNNDVDIVSSYIDEFNDDFNKPLRYKTLPITHDEIAKMAKFRNPINHMSVMFKKSKILEIGSYQHVPYVEDYYLWIRALNNGAKLANIDEVLVHARVGNGMEKRRSNKAYIKSWKSLSEYMLRNKMISLTEYIKNMISVRFFVYMPVSMKSFIYKYILRKAK
jgi:glycosyltransferase involved in cell wall biosynthesis